jgi:PAS domain S-box-containing protein
MVGHPGDDLIGAAKTWRDRLHPDAQAVLNAAAQKMIVGGVVEFEYQLRHDAGHWVWLLSRGKVVEHDPAGEALRFAGTHIDITDRKRIEHALRISEESLSTTLQSIGDAVIATDADGLVTRMNPTAETLTGWPAGEALGQPLAAVFRIVDGQTRTPSVDPVQRVLEHGEIVGLANDTLLLSRDGSERQIADSAAPIRTPAGAITGVVLVFSDVTESYRVQRALRDSELQMRLVTDAMPAAIGRFDTDLRFLFANRAFELLLGQPASAILGRTFGEVFGEAAMAKVAPYIRRVAAGERVTFEEAFDTPELGRRQAVVNMVPDFGAGGRVRGHFSITTDVTELRALEEHLRESQKMDSIGTLAGGIAHDFNNVLGAVIGNVELALERLGSAHPARQNLEQVRRASQRARGLVQQILTFSRRQPEQLVTMPLQPLVEETLKILRSTLPARVELATQIADIPLYVNADASQIQQVLMNLGTNAWHALGGEPGRILVGIDSVSLGTAGTPSVPGLAEGQYAHLWVSDNGAGITPTNRHRIFEPFFTTKAVGQGTGLGLSVVHGIVRTHLGAIAVDTTPAVGTTFHVYLPATQRPSQIGALDEAEATQLRGRGQHVMYVDDDEVIGVLVEELLAQAGYRVTACRDAKAALAAFIESPRAFDLVVTDFNMPDFTGLELAEKLTLIRPDLPMVISSGYVSDELRVGARIAGIRHVLQKQNTFEELAGLVHQALAAADAERESGPQ